ncbi:shikimate kinase [Rothia mucilaginosa]|uniref:shikimate kinase n=1 Tax=Rothia mucilaginosa TaxID=43675 RepID=UPI0028D2866D|nr:shikimate kinase [Rothia mucilaginosa]
MPLPAESEDRGTKGRGSGEVSVEQGVRPVASSPLARIAAATQRARGGASPRPETGAESGVSAVAEQSVEAAGAGAREAVAREDSSRPASRVPTPADLMRSGARPLPAAATASTQGVRLYASSVSEDADPALGLDEDLRLKLLSALQGMGTAEEESRRELAKAEAPKPTVPMPAPAKPAAPKPAAPSVIAALKPTAPKPAAPKPAPPKQAQLAEAAGESATASAPVQKAEPQSAPTAPKLAAPKPAPAHPVVAPKPAPPKQAQLAEAAGESATASAPVQKAEPQSAPTAPKLAAPKPAPAHPVVAPAAEPAKPVRPTPALFGKVQVAAPAEPAVPAEPATPAESVAPAELTVPAELAVPAEALAEDESACGARIHPQQVREMHENFAERSRPIVLIGPMAAGKTYIGTHLARFYGYEFLDADQLIVERYGEVSEIFEIFGEAHFRELERKTIEEVLTSPMYRNTVFSLGGGAPMTDSVAELLKDECVVYILVDAETVTPRITGNKTRPLLQPNPVERWTEIFERRRSRYGELAHFTLDARGGRPITEMTAEIQAYVTATRASRAQRPQA